MNKKYFISIVTLFVALIIGSCTDTSEDPTDDTKKYIGIWNVTDNTTRINYVVEIEPNPSNSTEILLNNFADLGDAAVALVVGNSIVIDTQLLGSGYTISGSGSYINNKKLSITYNINDGIDSETRNASFTR